ncbi:hypothetical protein GQ457_13G014190 [Hibiscus cannabinus]
MMTHSPRSAWCAITRIEKEEMLQHSRKDDEQRDAAALDKLKKTTKDAPIPAYRWTFEAAVPACGGTFIVAEMLQHSGVQNRQSAEKTKQPYILLLTWHPLQDCPPREGNIPLFR